MYYVNRYYDVTEDRRLTSDTEGTLVILCRDCAWLHSDQVDWAGRGDEESVCEECDADNHMQITTASGTFPNDDPEDWSSPPQSDR